MHRESFIINCNTLLHVSTLLGHLQGELFVIVTLRLHLIVERECAVDCVLRCFWRRELSAVPACTAGRDRREFIFIFIFIGKEVYRITNIFKKFNLGIAYKTKNTIYKTLSKNMHPNPNSKFNLNGIYQLTCPDRKKIQRQI
jgi:hypothetical protein